MGGGAEAEDTCELICEYFSVSTLEDLVYA